MSSSNSPCAACKFLRRKCTQGCVFSPYFPPDQPQKFANVHRVFGASNVAKLLNELSPPQREDAVNSLAYEAEARLRDPVYGCVGYIFHLQQKLKQIQHDLYAAKKELATYIGPVALGTFLPPHHSPFSAPFHQQHQIHGASSAQSYSVPGIGMGLGLTATSQMLLREQQQQQIAAVEAQQLAAVAAAVREQEILRSLEQQQDIARFNTRFVDGRGFSPMGGTDGIMVPAAATGTNSVASPPSEQAVVSPQQFDNPFHLHHQNQQQEAQQQQQLQLHQYMEHHQANQQQQQHQRAGSEEGRSGIGPIS